MSIEYKLKLSFDANSPGGFREVLPSEQNSRENWINSIDIRVTDEMQYICGTAADRSKFKPLYQSSAEYTYIQIGAADFVRGKGRKNGVTYFQLYIEKVDDKEVIKLAFDPKYVLYGSDDVNSPIVLGNVTDTNFTDKVLYLSRKAGKNKQKILMNLTRVQ